MKPAEAVVRARSATGKGCIYRLGKGGMDGNAATPWGAILACDCSGFAMWCLGLSRLQGETWYDTTRIVTDARDPEAPLFSAVPWEQAQPGDLVVWPDAGGHQGHVGVVATVAPAGPDTVVHCSMGNFHATGDAIRETPAEMFLVNHAIVARCTRLEVVA